MRALIGQAVALELALVVVGLLAGCATHRIDWAGRVGTYTYDQAVLELGPPDKFARLADGTTVAEWLTQRGYAYSYGPATYGPYPWGYGPYYPGYGGVYSSPDYFLRLIFNPDGRLSSWKSFYK
jgi:hypothetical protein